MSDDDYARGPGHHTRSRGPVVDAYAETDALTRPCPHCGAAVEEFCIHESGVQRKMPCPDRLHANEEGGPRRV